MHVSISKAHYTYEGSQPLIKGDAFAPPLPPLNPPLYTFSNPSSSLTETVEGYCAFGNPRLSPTETVKGYCTFGNPRSSSAVTVVV